VLADLSTLGKETKEVGTNKDIIILFAVEQNKLSKSIYDC
jgi:hypothetical protein